MIGSDSKVLRHSGDEDGGKVPIHLVSAWASASRLVLGQRKVEEKSNEVTAIPDLLKLLELRGCIVMIDAMGCQTEIADRIIAPDADYVLALKGNQAWSARNSPLLDFTGVGLSGTTVSLARIEDAGDGATRVLRSGQDQS